ncbi:hypothetical protein [Agrobacterium rubi]|uniref:hypothetical protein n=1 Tax=Agrobacterium rubi TaxID=28099 RepID=UPI001573ED19|nr:hypothetical protein [Agrobacterium rubi]NTE87195.1 hypothetical protein [Agrobacterium rubi]NTF03129.1 hypothetical protein [Agrobacterium rubi]
MSNKDFVDLSGLEALVQSQEDGIDIELVNEKGEKLGLSVRVVGPDSDRMQKAMRDVSAEFAKAAVDAGTLAENIGDDDGARLSAILSKATLGWSPNPKIGGQVVPFSEANARNLYSKFKIIRDQVEAKAARRSSFTKS